MDGLRRKRLALLHKKKLDLRRKTSDDQGHVDDLAVENCEAQVELEDIDREIGVLNCARRDLF